MIKILMLCIIVFFPSFSSAKNARPVILVYNNFITLKNLFGSFGVVSNTIIGASPKLGKKFLVTHRQVQKILKLYSLHYNVMLYPNGLIVKRIEKFISKDTIVSVLRKKFTHNKILSRAIFTLKSLPLLTTPRQSDFSISVSKFNYLPSSKKFYGIIHVMSHMRNVFGKISGNIKYLTIFFILKHSLQPGQIINATDLKMKSMKSFSYSKNNISSINQIIGNCVKYPLQQGTILTLDNLSIPEAISKGDLVNVYTRIDGIFISIQGIAMSSGKVGSDIKIMNNKSDTILQGIVEGTDKVKINPYSSPNYNSLNKDYNRNFSSNYYARMHRS